MRTEQGQWLSEVVATFLLVLVVFGVLGSDRTSSVTYAVGGYVTAAYWFTSSTSFANPAITVARTLTDRFAGIGPTSAPALVLAQLAGAALAVGAVRALHPDARRIAARAATVDPSGPVPAEEHR